MHNDKRKIIRSTKAQQSLLVDYMSSNVDFAIGEFSGPLRTQKYEEEWAKLANLLSEHGPHRTAEQWKQSWRDLKRKAREEGNEVKIAKANNSQAVPFVSNLTPKILNIIGHECATELAGAEENSMGDASQDIPSPFEFAEVEFSPGSPLQESPPQHPPPAPQLPPPTPQRPLHSSQHFQRSSMRPHSTSRSRLSSCGTTSACSNAVKFIAMQKRTNKLLEELKEELRRSNELRKEQLDMLKKNSESLPKSEFLHSAKDFLLFIK